MKKTKQRISLFRWIWSNFLKTALIPLILVEFVFICIYFLTNAWTQHETVSYLKTEVTEELNELSLEKANSIENQLNGISDVTKLMAMGFKDALAAPAVLQPEYANRLSLSSEGAFYTTKDKSEGGVAIFYSGYYPIGPNEKNKVARTLAMERTLKYIVKSYPLANQVYMNTFDSLNIIYPYFDVISQYAAKMNIPSL